jgi:hypothetical protein
MKTLTQRVESAKSGWDAMIRRYARRDRQARILLAILSSGTAASLLFTFGEAWMWKVAISVCAVISILLSVFDVPRTIEGMAALKRTWSEYLVDYESLWSKRHSFTDADDTRFVQIRKEEAQRTVDEAKFPRDDILLRICQAEVRRSRGL